MLPQHFNNIALGMSNKADGQMILDRAEEAKENRQRYFTREGVDPNLMVSARLVHGSTVKIVSTVDRGTQQAACDGLVTTDAAVGLTVSISDCLPLFFFDEMAGVTGMAHAGWRGVVGNIAQNMVQTMVNCGSQAQNIQVIIGPHIKPCHFETQVDILPQFLPYPNAIITRQEKIFINLTEIVTEQLLQTGMMSEHITEHSDCTYCKTEYFSYRRGDAPSQMAWIMKR